MIDRFYKSRQKCFIRSPLFLFVSATMVLFDVIFFVLPTTIFGNFLLVITFLPVVVVAGYLIICREEINSKISLINDVYFSKAENEIVNILFFAVVSGIYYVHLIIVLCLPRIDTIFTVLLPLAGLAYIMWIYTICVFLVFIIVRLICKNNIMSFIVVFLTSYADPAINLVKGFYYFEVKRMLYYSKYDLIITEQSNKALNFGIYDETNILHLAFVLFALVLGLFIVLLKDKITNRGVFATKKWR